MHRVGKLFQVEEFAHPPPKKGKHFNLPLKNSWQLCNFAIHQHACNFYFYVFIFLLLKYS